MKNHSYMSLIAVSLILLTAVGCSSVSRSVKSETSSANINKLATMSSTSKPQGNQLGLSVATWNVEHLAYPSTAGCKPRTVEELAELKRYAASIDADIIGLQEVASTNAVAQLFPPDEWQIVISQRPDSESYECRKTGFASTQQKIAFAVRKKIPIVDVVNHQDLGLDNPGLRYGLEVVVESPFGAVSILNVHLKSGCFVDNYSRADSEACETFAAQAPVLDGWLEEKESQGQPYMILGDFNHRLSAPYNHLTRQLARNKNGLAASIVNSTAKVIGCHPYYPAPIDHILFGKFSPSSLRQVVKVHAFENMEVDAMLSDHCAISLSLMPKQLPLSSAVTWVTKSKEYSLLTQSIYQQATQSINARSLPQESWVVVMDVDETILDNSEYQVRLDKSGNRYNPETWADWVAEEKATLVPGVKSFIESVLARGGKLALVTNRDRKLDRHTWNNIKKLGVAITTENTCLFGRVDKDKAAIDNIKIFNDKDLRRMQIESGRASCFSPNNQRHSTFGKQLILMQVGDNIEDFSKAVQEYVDVETLLPKANNEYVLLPNPMYGSW